MLVVFYVIWFLLNFFISISPFSSLFCAYRNSFLLVCTFKRTILENSLHFQKEEMCYVIMGSNGNRVYRCIQVDGEIYGVWEYVFFSLEIVQLSHFQTMNCKWLNFVAQFVCKLSSQLKFSNQNFCSQHLQCRTQIICIFFDENWYVKGI